jgi:hypothetical protein
LLFGIGGLAALVGVWRAVDSDVIAVPESQAVSSADTEQVVHLLAAIHAVATRPVLVAEVDRSFGLAAASTANRQLTRPMAGFRDDCSGFVSAVMTEEGLDMDGRVITIYERAVENDAIHWDLVPIAGDLVFFDDTHDRNNNGLLDDDLTHIGIVLDVEPDGTVVFGHAGLSSGRGVGRLNLYTPGMRDRSDGERVNSILRSPKSWDPPGAVHLAGELFAGFARVDPDLDWTTDP